MKTATHWDVTDGWILMSIYLAGNSGRIALHAVIRAADAMNHAIPTRAELSTSLNKLVSANVVRIVERDLSINSDYIPDIQGAFEGRGGLFVSPDKGRRWLERAKVFPREHDPSAAVSESEYTFACNFYTNEIS